MVVDLRRPGCMPSTPNCYATSSQALKPLKTASLDLAIGIKVAARGELDPDLITAACVKI